MIIPSFSFVHFIFLYKSLSVPFPKVYFSKLCFFNGSTALVSLGSSLFQVSRSHLDTPHSVGPLVVGLTQRPLPHNTHKRETSMPPAEFERAIPISERRQTHALDQCFSTAGPRPGTGPWHRLYRAARGSPGICHFSFLSIFHE